MSISIYTSYSLNPVIKNSKLSDGWAYRSAKVTDVIFPVLIAMATGGAYTFPNLEKALEEAKHSPSEPETSPPTVELKLLLWNIHGDTFAGMAAAREMLVQKVYSQCNPDIFLLQEVVTPSKCLPQQIERYSFRHCAVRPGEAYIGYDLRLFDNPRKINIQEVIGNKRLLSGKTALSTRSDGPTPDQVFYSDRSCAIRLRHCSTGKELVLMSFHNASSRTGGGKDDVISSAQGFIKLVCLVYEHEKVPVIAGGDFNCDRSDLQDHAKEMGCELPNYESSERRKSKEKIDLYVVKSSRTGGGKDDVISSAQGFIKLVFLVHAHEKVPGGDFDPYVVKSSPEDSCRVDVFEVLPLVDPTSTEADTHPLGRESIRYLVDNAPVNKKTGVKLTWQDYNKVTNHDPTICQVKLTY